MQFLLVQHELGLIRLGPRLDLHLLDLHQRIGLVCLARQLLLQFTQLLHVISNLGRDHRFALHGRDDLVRINAILTEEFGLDLLLGLQTDVLEHVLLQRQRCERIALQNRRHALHKVRNDVRIVQLASKGLQVHAVQHICVLRCRVLGHAHTLRTQDAVDITDVHRRVHAIERLIHVVHLRRGLRQLQLRLCQRHALRGRENVGIGNGQHRHHVVEVLLLDRARGPRHVVGVLIRQVRPKTLGQQLEFDLLGIVQPTMNRRHDHRAPFEQCNRGSHRRILVAIAHLHVRCVGQALTRFHREAQQLEQRL